MSGSVVVAVAAAIGNLLQGWDNATIAGAVLYIKKEFKLEDEPTMEGLIVAMPLIGATVVTTFSGQASDHFGRRPILIISSLLYFVGGLVMLWSPNVYVLLFARLLDGFGIGLSVTFVPLYISETAPPEIRGLLNTLPQFTGSLGMFLSYCMVFGMSLTYSPSWRLMLGIISALSLVYFGLAVFFLPESPRWLVSKGRMLEARQVLQRLRGWEDVSGELALLVEGLGVGGEASLEKYIIGPANEPDDDLDPEAERDHIKIYGQEGISFTARVVPRESTVDLLSRHGSLVDPVVALFRSIHEKLPDNNESRRSAFFATLGSMFSITGEQPKTDDWDEESLISGCGEDCASDDIRPDEDSDNNDNDLQSPLISRQTTSLETDMVAPASHGSIIRMQQGNEGPSSTGIGGGWQLAWKWTKRESEDGKEGEFRRIYLYQEGSVGSPRGSLFFATGGTDVHGKGQYVQATALVSKATRYSRVLMSRHTIGPEMIHLSENTTRGSAWSDLLEPEVKHALVIGAGIQILQQFSGINGFLYYTPQILEQAGVGILLSNMGIGSTSASLLISSVTTLLMLPCIAIAMQLMDTAGRRMLLLSTIPVLIASLVILVIGNIVNMGTVVHAVISTVSVVVYFCCFVMGLGPIPNILCSEMFPTRVRGLCIAICALVFWIGDIIVTYTLPVMLNSVGLAGVFAMYAVVCLVTWGFIFLKVPETKGMALEVITEFFSAGAKKNN